MYNLSACYWDWAKNVYYYISIQQGPGRNNQLNNKVKKKKKKIGTEGWSKIVLLKKKEKKNHQKTVLLTDYKTVCMENPNKNLFFWFEKDLSDIIEFTQYIKIKCISDFQC